MNLTNRQKAILVGTLLGDASLQKTGMKNARLRLEHGIKQKEYLLFKGEQFPKLFSTKPEFIERIHPLTRQIYGYWRWQSNASPVLGKWRELFYGKGKKYIPENLSEILTDPLSLAVWYMDDGFYDPVQKHSFIYLGRVTRPEAEVSKEAILKNFNIVTKVYDKKEKGFALFFSVSETRKLHKAISEHILPSLGYKISLTP